MSLTTKLALPLLVLLPPFALLSLHALQFRNGFYALMTHLRDAGPHVLPHSADVPILAHFTGSGTVDYWLQVLNCFFAPCFTQPELQVLALEFAGALGVVVAVLAVEGERRGWRVAGLSTLWGLLMQSVSFGLTMPLYALLSLALPPTTRLPRDPTTLARLSTLPFSLFLGYALPTLLTAIPAPHVTPDTHQRLVAAWQFFPLYIALFQSLLPRLRSAAPAPPRTADFASALDRLFTALIHASRLAHFAAVGLSIVHMLYPASAAAAVPFSFARLLTPANPFTPIQAVSSFGDGVLAFLQWDYLIGMVAAVVWMGWLRARAAEMAAKKGKVVKGGSGEVIDWVLVVVMEGPGALVARWAWEREVVLLTAGEGAGKEE